MFLWQLGVKKRRVFMFPQRVCLAAWRQIESTLTDVVNPFAAKQIGFSKNDISNFLSVYSSMVNVRDKTIIACELETVRLPTR